MLIQSLKGVDVKNIASGSYHNLLQTKDNQLYSWGCNDRGQCGQLTKQHQKLYAPFKILSQAITDIHQISCGENFSGFLRQDGQVYSFGDNSEGQLALGDVVPGFKDSDTS